MNVNKATFKAPILPAEPMAYPGLGSRPAPEGDVFFFDRTGAIQTSMSDYTAAVLPGDVYAIAVFSPHLGKAAPFLVRFVVERRTFGLNKHRMPAILGEIVKGIVAHLQARGLRKGDKLAVPLPKATQKGIIDRACDAVGWDVAPPPERTFTAGQVQAMIDEGFSRGIATGKSEAQAARTISMTADELTALIAEARTPTIQIGEGAIQLQQPGSRSTFSYDENGRVSEVTRE